MKNKLKKRSPIKAFVKGVEIINSGHDGSGSVELIGNRVIIEEATAILEYETDKVRVSSGGRVIVIDGSKLTMKSYADKIIIVEGKISGVSLE